MKKALIALTLMLAIQAFLPAQQSYTVHVGTFLDVRPQDFDPIRPLGFVYVNAIDGNLHQVYIGGYTTQAAAQSTADALRQRGFDSAQIQARDLRAGQQVTVIQMATRYLNKPIDWEHLQQAGQLYVILEDERIKVVAGVYEGIPAANQTLPAIKQLGYDDAFVKSVNSAELIKVTGFSTGLKEPLIPLNFTETPPPSPTTSPSPEPETRVNSQPVSMNTTQDRIVTTPRTPTVPRPDNASPASPPRIDREPVPATSTPAAVPAMANVGSLPEINGRVKRNSAMELQRVLQSSGYYSSTLDGYYGPGTTGAYQAMMAQDPSIRKYQILAANFPNPSAGVAGNRMQQAIDRLPTDPNASLIVEGSAEPMARAYQAYQLFLTTGPTLQVNNRMNEAIRSAYEGKTLTQVPPFDYRATYAYQDLNQLVKHLFFVHAAPGTDYAVPCWIYSRHPAEAAQAQDAISNFTNHFQVQACDGFQSWPEIQLLQAVAFDITPNARGERELLASATAHRSALYLSSSPLNTNERAAVDRWHERLWASLSTWAATDPMHADAAKALRVTYFQSLVRLEDYYMDRGFSSSEATGLALASIQSLAGVPLNRFAR